jgi:hypothetical protein
VQSAFFPGAKEKPHKSEVDASRRNLHTHTHKKEEEEEEVQKEGVTTGGSF